MLCVSGLHPPAPTRLWPLPCWTWFPAGGIRTDSEVNTGHISTRGPETTTAYRTPRGCQEVPCEIDMISSQPKRTSTPLLPPYYFWERVDASSQVRREMRAVCSLLVSGQDPNRLGRWCYCSLQTQSRPHPRWPSAAQAQSWTWPVGSHVLPPESQRLPHALC